VAREKYALLHFAPQPLEGYGRSPAPAPPARRRGCTAPARRSTVQHVVVGQDAQRTIMAEASGSAPGAAARAGSVGNVRPGASAAAPNAGAPAGGVGKGKKKKKKVRVRGEKPRMRTVLREDERPSVVRLSRGRTREFDILPRRNAEMSMPRKMRTLLAAKSSLQAKAAAKLRPAVPPTLTTAAKEELPPQTAVPQERKTTRQIVIETVRKNSHQHVKKKAYHAKREERAAARKERRKHRRRRTGSDSDDGVRVERAGPAAPPGFSSRAQAQAPPKLNPVIKRHRR
jgi:hypothetical protein